jgi:hypothetical protein
MLVFGFMTFAAGSWQMTYLTKDFGFWQIFMPQVLRGVGLMFAMVPITNLALGTLPPERLKNASGLFNLTRNLGGAFGLAALNTVLDDRHQTDDAARARAGHRDGVRRRISDVGIAVRRVRRNGGSDAPPGPGGGAGRARSPLSARTFFAFF